MTEPTVVSLPGGDRLGEVDLDGFDRSLLQSERAPVSATGGGA